MKKLIIIADVAADSLSLQEIKSSIEGALSEPERARISHVVSTPSTIHTAYLMSQIIQTEERYGTPGELIIFSNTDPRTHATTGVSEAQGAKGVIIKLVSGIYVIGPNAGNCFSLIKDKIEHIYTYQPLLKGSQFRSRDNYPRVVAHLMEEMEDELEMDDIPASAIPEFKGHFIGHIDNFGNLKTTITKEDLKGNYEFGDSITVEINNIKQIARYIDNLFGAVPGQLVVYPGSSGKPDNRFIEISAWSHFGNTSDNSKTGRDFFEGVKPGDEIKIS